MPRTASSPTRIAAAPLALLVAVVIAGCATSPNGGTPGGAGAPPAADATAAAREAAALERRAEIAVIEDLLRVRTEGGRRAPMGDVDLARVRELEAMSTPALEAELERLRAMASEPAADGDDAY